MYFRPAESIAPHSGMGAWMPKPRKLRAEAEMIRDTVLPQMGRLRLPCDQAETLTPKKYWPFPTYGDLLFGVR